jgi:hypothetical protein
VVEQGRYVGSIVFHGEHGFTRVRAHRAAGTITRTPPLQCAPVAPSRDPKQIKREIKATESAKEDEEAEGDSLSVALTATARGRHVVLKASKAVVKGEKGFSLTTFSVIGTRRRGRIKETGLAVLPFERGSTFLIPDRRHPTSEVVLKPPAPFTGAGTFRRHPAKPSTWTGNLKVALPGFGVVRLAGPGTRAQLCGNLACLF